MTKKLYAEGITGKVAIYDGGSDAPRDDPYANLDKLYFHSDLDYVGVTDLYTGVITHPQRTASTQSDKYLANNKQPLTGTQEWTLLTFPDRGYIPHGIIVVNGEQLPGAAPIQRSGPASARYAMLRMTATAAILHERWHTFNNTIAALNVTYRLFIFSPPIVQSGNKSLLITPEQMIASLGKLDTDLRYARAEEATPDFRLIRGATADARAGGLRMVTPGGTVIDDDVYSGSFAGSPSKGCTI